MSRTSLIRLSISLLVVLGAAGAIFLLTRTRLPSDLRGAAPREAIALVHVRAHRLLQTKAFDQLVRQRGLDAGMKRVEEICGFNPVEQVDEGLVFAMPVRDEALPEWGALLRGDLDPRQLADCVKKAMEAQGGESNLQRAEIEGVPCAVSSRGDTRACAVWDGLIVGTEATATAAVKAMTGKGESVLARPGLTEPWDALDEGAEVRAVATIPKNTRTLLRSVVGPFLPESFAALTRIESLSGQLFTGGDDLVGKALFVTSNAEDATAVDYAFKVILSKMRDSAAIVLTPARTLVNQTEVKLDGLRIQVDGRYPLHAVSTVMDLIPVATRMLGLGEAARLLPQGDPASAAPADAAKPATAGDNAEPKPDAEPKQAPAAAP